MILDILCIISWFLFGHRPNRVIKIARFESKLQKARNTCECKQGKWRECLRRECLHAIVLYKVESMPETKLC